MADQIYTMRKLRRGLFGFRAERPQAGPGKMLVLTGGGAPIVLAPGQKPTAGESVWNHYNTIIELDTGHRDFSFTSPVPAQGGDVSFQMTFSASYMVSDPLRVINEGLVSPEPALKRVLTESISRITEAYDIENVKGAMEAVRKAVDKDNYTERLPFVLSTINVKLELDNQAREFLNKRRQIRREAELAAGSMVYAEKKGEAQRQGQQIEHSLEKTQSQHDLDIERQRAEADIERDRVRAKHQLELDKLRAENALEVQKMRMDVYKQWLQGGMWDMLLLRLADNPGDVTQVSEIIMQLHAQQLAADRSMLETMIQGGLIEDRNVRDVATNLLRRLSSAGVPGQPALEARSTTEATKTGAAGNGASNGKSTGSAAEGEDD